MIKHFNTVQSDLVYKTAAIFRQLCYMQCYRLSNPTPHTTQVFIESHMVLKKITEWQITKVE